MAFLYDPGTYMPRNDSDFSATSWLVSWPNGPWHLHDVEPGGTVFLVNVASQTIVWETRVTHTFAVPYEALGDLSAEILRRWGLAVETPKMVPGGFCIGWRAEPVARLDRQPIPLLTAIDEEHRAELSLTGWQISQDQTDGFHRRWELTREPEPFCDGRSPVGWFGPDRSPFGIAKDSPR